MGLAFVVGLPGKVGGSGPGFDDKLLEATRVLAM